MRPTFPWNRLRAWATLGRRVQIIFAVLGLVAVMAPDSERTGDRFQVALPILALGCEVVNGSGLEYLGRYAVMFVGVHGTKNALGLNPINHRPKGGLQGFPSGHTATAAFGATSLIQSCITHAPVAQIVVALATAYTGGSRIETRWHSLTQVMAGAVWGIFCSMAFRKDTAARRAIAAALARVWARLRQGFGPGNAALAQSAFAQAEAWARHHAPSLRSKAMAFWQWLKTQLDLKDKP